MSNLYQHKEAEVLNTPLIFFDLKLKNGSSFYWSTHELSAFGNNYQARILRHDAFELRFLADGMQDFGRISLVLANPDGFFTPVTARTEWKGADLVAKFAFFDLASNQVVSGPRILFRGVCGGMEEADETTLRLSFHNRLNLQRASLPSVRLQDRCPWYFPESLDQRNVAATGDSEELYSVFFKCGYSPDVPGGVGSLGPQGPYSSCDYTRLSCEQRGMFSSDSLGRPTRRFAGVEQQGTGNDKNVSLNAGNTMVPIVYGTSWIEAPSILSQTAGTMSYLHAVIGAGPIQGVSKVLANQYEIPEFQPGRSMESTGWYQIVSRGDRVGEFDGLLPGSNSSTLPGPYGSIAYLHLALPQTILRSGGLPNVMCLVQGLVLPRFDLDGTPIPATHTANPAWVMLDILRRTGWNKQDLNIESFAKQAAYCDELVDSRLTDGSFTLIPRFRCNLGLQNRRSFAELLRGLHASTGLYVRYDEDGRLSLSAEAPLSIQSPTPPPGTNAVSTLDGGWPSYEFGDGTYGFSGIARKENGEPSIRFFSRPASDCPNKVLLEFFNEFNHFVRDSYAVSEVTDLLASGQDLAVTSKALGVPNYNQASRAARLQLLKSVRGNFYTEFSTSVKAIGLSPGDLITVTYQRQGLDRIPFRVIRISPATNCALIRVVAQIHDDSWYETPAVTFESGATSQRNGQAPRPIIGNQVADDGTTQFSISELSLIEADGSGSTVLRAEFLQPSRPVLPVSMTPRLSLHPTVYASGGALAPNQILYYAVTSVDDQEREGPLSPIAKASLGDGGSSYRVRLTDLSFHAGTSKFHVYRGCDPYTMLRIASDIPISAAFTDGGDSSALIAPPDELYHHAKFYWRLECLPPTNANLFSANSIGSTALNLTADEFAGRTLRICSGTGEGQERLITSHTATTVNLSPDFTVGPDASSVFAIAESSWHFAVSTATSPAEFEVPNRPGATVQVSARAATADEKESEVGLSPVTRWDLGGAFGSGTDSSSPPTPTFALSIRGEGEIDVLGVAFSSLQNTRTISSGTLTLHHWNELTGPCQFHLASGLNANDEFLAVSALVPLQAGDLAQVGTELMRVEEMLNDGSTIKAERGAFGTTAAAHADGTPVYPLSRQSFVLPFQKGLFGSPAGGSFHHPLFIPNVRIAAAELYVTNAHGNSPARQYSYSSTLDEGMRTLSGGQFSIQVAGHLALQNAAAPVLLIETDHAVKDLFAVVAEAPSGGDIQLAVRQDGLLYAALTIPAGETSSNTVTGFGLPPLRTHARVTLDIISVPSGGLDTPGRDLTVILRV